MQSASICHAEADQPFARRLADFLEVNFSFAVSYEDAAEDIIHATGRAISADLALVLLSPASVPKPLPLGTWEDAFLEQPKELMTPLGFVLLGDCPFPKLLRRERFFDASRGELRAFRDIKRWLLRPNEITGSKPEVSPDLEDLRRSLVDRPGIALDVRPDLSERFAVECGDEFEAVYRLDCSCLSHDGVLAEIGLTQPGRVLLVLGGVHDVLPEMARASVIFTSAVEGAIPNAASDAVRNFAREASFSAGWPAVALLKQQARLVEALEILDAMAQTARDSGDDQALTRVEREQYWLRDDLGYDAPAIALRLDPAIGGQLSFAFQ
jgi:hypothetical protein